MNRKNIGYINTLTDLNFLLVQQEILENSRSLSSPYITGIVSTYELMVKKLEQIVHVPYQKVNPYMMPRRISTYNSCRKTVNSLRDFIPEGHEAAVNNLVKAFGESICRVCTSDIIDMFEDAEKVLQAVPREELDFFSLTERVDLFLEMNRNYRQSLEAESHNKQVRKKGDVFPARRDCVALYRCMMAVAKSLARRGDNECARFLAWLKY